MCVKQKRKEKKRRKTKTEYKISKRNKKRDSMSAEDDAAELPGAWPLYFDEDYDADDRRRMLVAELVAFFASPQGARFFALNRGRVRAVGGGAANCGADVAFSVDYDDLAAACGSADLVASLEVQPVEGLACLAAAAHEVSALERRKRERKNQREEEEKKGLSECVTASRWGASSGPS